MAAAANDNNHKEFTYEAISPTGARIKGRGARMRATNAEEVRRVLVDNGLIPLKIKNKTRFSMDSDLKTILTGGKVKLKPGQVASLARQMHTLLRAGVSVPNAVESAAKETKNQGLADILRDIAAKVRAGTPVSDAFGDYPATFDEIFVGYLQAGEETGSFVDATERLAEIAEKKSSLNHKIKGVTAYPKMVGSAIGLMVLVILKVVLPKFEEMYVDFGVELPAPTRAVQALARHIMPISADWFLLFPKPWTIRPTHIWLFDMIPWPSSPILWVVGIIWGVRRWLRSKEGDLDIGRKFDRIKFRIPIFGKLNQLSAVYRWTTTLSGSMAAGVHTASALELAADASGSRWLKAITPDIVSAINSGRTLSAIVEDYPELFPQSVRTMLATGEQAGEVAAMLASAAQGLDDEIDSLIAGLSSKIEVALLMILSGVVLVLLVVLYAPIMSLAQNVLDANK
ncbi:MAG: type II secretion system F family protein [Actinomycetia bacterium]|nr:type II secretion system F family protein [Actinomycetes bacterium]